MLAAVELLTRRPDALEALRSRFARAVVAVLGHGTLVHCAVRRPSDVLGPRGAEAEAAKALFAIDHRRACQ